MASLYLPEIEQDLLGILLNEPTVWPDVLFTTREEFAEVRQHLFDALKQQLDSGQSVAPSVIAEKLKSYGQSGNEIGGLDTFMYVDGLSRRGRLLDKKHALGLAKELKLSTVRRQLIAKCEGAIRELRNPPKDEPVTFASVTGLVQKTLSSVTTEYFKGGETTDLFATMRADIEAAGNKTEEDLGYVGVIPSIDRTLGPLFHPGSFSLIGARSGGNKSSFGFYYAVTTAELHDLPVLWLDAGEMTEKQLIFRAACCFSKGRIPLWAARGNGWRTKPEWVDIMRGEVFPRAEKLIGRFGFKNVSGMTREEKISFMRRYHHNKIGKDRFLIIVDDYLKGMENMGKETKEYQTVGYYTSDVKSLVTNEINAGFMTFVQLNRFGVSKGRKAEDIVDNDSTISLSDRIKDNCTSVLLMRYKVVEELARERNAFGNVLLKTLKIREGLGRDYESFARPIKLAKGFAEDYFNLEYHGFHFKDMGRFSDVCARLGHTAIDLSQREGGEPMP